MKSEFEKHGKKNDGEIMDQPKAEAIVARLLSNADGLRYGSVSVTAKVHEGRVVGLMYSTTENTKETEDEENRTEKTGSTV